MDNIENYFDDVGFLAPQGWDLRNFANNQDIALLDNSSAEYVGNVEGAKTWDILSNPDPDTPDPRTYADYYMFNDPGANSVNKIVPAESTINQGWIEVPTESREYVKKDISGRIEPILSGDASPFMPAQAFGQVEANESNFFQMWKVADGQIVDMDALDFAGDISDDEGVM